MTVSDKKVNVSDEKEVPDSKLIPPKPKDVPALTVNDILTDHLEAREKVIWVPSKDGEGKWLRVTFGKISHNEWLQLQKTKVDPQGTYDYYQKLIMYSSIEPKIAQEDWDKKKIDSDFFVAYAEAIEKYIQECRFL